MSNGHRGLGLATLVVALLLAFGLGVYWQGLPQPKERYQPYQSSNKVEERAATTIADVAPSVVQRTPCNNPQSEGESDLCAQWRAAKAAEKSADWTKWGVIASIAGISLLLWQIMLTREAVKDTGDATLAMQEANDLARKANDAATATMRPRIIVTAGGERLVDKRPWLIIYVTNLGKEDCVIDNFCGEWRKTDDFGEVNGYLASYRQTIVRAGETVEIAYAESQKALTDMPYFGGVITYTSPQGSQYKAFFLFWYVINYFRGAKPPDYAKAIAWAGKGWPVST